MRLRRKRKWSVNICKIHSLVKSMFKRTKPSLPKESLWKAGSQCGCFNTMRKSSRRHLRNSPGCPPSTGQEAREVRSDFRSWPGHSPLATAQAYLSSLLYPSLGCSSVANTGPHATHITTVENASHRCWEIHTKLILQAHKTQEL